MFQFNVSDIEELVLRFMNFNGIYPKGYLRIVSDGHIHRFSTNEDHGGEKSGAYCIYSDEWPAGWVKDWRKGDTITWCFPHENLNDEGRKQFPDEKAMLDAIDRSREKARKRQAELEQIQLQASDMARSRFDTFKPAPDDHPYLKNKHVRNFGLRWQSDINSLIVPLRDINGRFLSYQSIDAEGNKRFYTDAPTKGAFFSVALDILNGSQDDTILIGEGYSTMATVYDLTSLPCVAAMNCYNLRPVCEALKSKYPNARIIIIADNDAYTQSNPGITKANEACEALNLQGVVYPEFDAEHHGSDWNDYAQAYGEDKARKVLQEKISYAYIPRDKKHIFEKVHIINAHDLLQKSFPPIKWAVEGFLPSGCTILGGNPKAGKSILALHIAVAVALGGYALGKIPCIQGNVLYLALEDSERRLQERILNSNILNGEIPDLSLLDIVYDLPKQHEGGIFFIDFWLQQHPDARLVIIDTLQKFRKPLSGKGHMYAEDYETVGEIKRLADKFDIPFLIVHHLKKGQESSDWLNEFSGSQGIAGSADTLFSLKRARNEKVCTLHRTGRDVEEKDFTLRLDGFGWVLESDVEKFTLPEWKRNILDYLREHKRCTPNELSQALNLPPATARQNLKRLLREGFIRKTGYATYEIQQ